MDSESSITARENRAVRIDTVDGSLEGNLRISPTLRTLDDLNLMSKRFVTLHAARSLSAVWDVGDGPLAINKTAVLFVRELSQPRPLTSGRFGSFTRSAVRLRVKTFEIEGFIHLPKDGEPMKRIEHDEHQFLSLTSALVTRGEEQATAPFVAVNRDYITAVELVRVSAVCATAVPADETR